MEVLNLICKVHIDLYALEACNLGDVCLHGFIKGIRIHNYQSPSVPHSYPPSQSLVTSQSAAAQHHLALRCNRRQPNISSHSLTSFSGSLIRRRRLLFCFEGATSLARAEVSKAGSETLRAMSDLDKERYVEVAEKRKAEYEKELAAYHQKMESDSRSE